MLRALIMFVSMLHACSELFWFSIIASNVTVILNGCLKIGKSWQKQTKFIASSQLISSLKRYRQLQIFNSVVNQVFSYILPVAVSLTFLCMVLMGYFLIKMTPIVPYTITFLVGSVFATIFCLGQGMLPKMAEVSTNSENFVRHWKLERFSRYLTRELKSLRCLRLNVGQFGYVKKSSRTQLFSHLLYYIMSSVIMVWGGEGAILHF